jgi:hypothetical protein
VALRAAGPALQRPEHGSRDGDLRRARPAALEPGAIGGDDWTSPEVPLGEAEERYLFELLDEGEVVLAREATAPEVVVTAAEEAALLPGGPHLAFEVRVAQLSETYGMGAARQVVVHA